MGSENPTQLKIFFLPFMAQGHIIPTIDMAKLFASKGAKPTIVTTPLNVHMFSKSIQRSKELGLEIEIKTIKFPSLESLGLPEGCENIDSVLSLPGGSELAINFFMAMNLLKEPLEQLLDETRPDCLVADMFFPWATDAAARFGIPRLVFHGTSVFSLCASECIRLYEPQRSVSSDSEPFLIPNLPGEIFLTKNKLGGEDGLDEETFMTRLMKDIKESEKVSFGVVLNSFYELESSYGDYFRNFFGKKAWFVGPVSLCNKRIEDIAERGTQPIISQHECLKWLDSKQPNSVIYICFGSMANFSTEQLIEIATGLEASGQNFIWVVRKNNNEDKNWLPEGFEERTAGKGLIIQGWAPQVLILEHEAVGGFVTHCGWNSTLEAISAGVPMVTWPLSAEQFYNEIQVTQILKIGVSAGAEKWVRFVGDFVRREKVEKVVREIMIGDGVVEMRRRSKGLKEMARKAVEMGGSSYKDLDNLINELSLHGSFN